MFVEYIKEPWFLDDYVFWSIISYKIFFEEKFKENIWFGEKFKENRLSSNTLIM